MWLLPFAALAAVTRNLRQFFLTVMAISVISYLLELWSSKPPIVRSHPLPLYSGLWLGAMWIDYFIVIAVLVTASLLILFLQYSRRRTAIARAISICAVTLVFGIPTLLTMQGITALQFRLSKSQVDASSLRITMDLNLLFPEPDEPMTCMCVPRSESDIRRSLPIASCPSRTLINICRLLPLPRQAYRPIRSVYGLFLLR